MWLPTLLDVRECWWPHCCPGRILDLNVRACWGPHCCPGRNTDLDVWECWWWPSRARYLVGGSDERPGVFVATPPSAGTKLDDLRVWRRWWWLFCCCWYGSIMMAIVAWEKHPPRPSPPPVASSSTCCPSPSPAPFLPPSLPPSPLFPFIPLALRALATIVVATTSSATRQVTIILALLHVRSGAVVG